ncbi:hypothetical protein HDU67_002412 [Dinochytrium kinnereticum]|nr:hypothetical protein HDU67_002412 [Dinochytrium kinnereticum]
MPSTTFRNRGPAVVSVSTTTTSLFSNPAYLESTPITAPERDYEGAEVSGTHILQVFNRVRRHHANSNVSYHWKTLRPLLVPVPDGPKDAPVSPTKSSSGKSKSGSSSPGSKRESPSSKSPSSSPKPLQYQSMGLFTAAMPPQATSQAAAAQPKPKPPPEPPAPVAYILRITSTDKPSEAPEYFSVSTVDAERLATKATFFHFLEKQHEDTLEKALQATSPSGGRGLLRSPPTSPDTSKTLPSTSSTHVTDSKWIIASLVPRPEWQPPTFHIRLPSGEDFGILLNWLKTGENEKLRNGLGAGTKPYAAYRFMGLLADAQRLGVALDLYKALAPWLYENWEASGLVNDERFCAPRIPEAIVVAGAAYAKMKDRSQLVYEMTMSWSEQDKTTALNVIRKADEMIKKKGKDAASRSKAKSPVASKPVDRIERGEVDVVRVLEHKIRNRKVETLYEDEPPSPFTPMRGRESAFYDDVKSVISAYRRSDDEYDAFDKHESQFDSGVSVTSSSPSSVTSLSMSDGESEWDSRGFDARASNFFDYAYRLALQSEEDEVVSASLPSPLSRPDGQEAVDQAAVEEFKVWASESSIRPNSSIAKNTDPSSPAVNSPTVRQKTKSPLTSPPVTRAGVGAGAGVFAGFDDDSSDEDDDSSALKKFLRRQNTSAVAMSPPPRMASAGLQLQKPDMKEEVVMTSVVVVRDWSGRVTNTCVYSWRADDQ